MARPTTYGLITKSLLTDIGNAVRTKNGTTELRTPSQLASDILALPTGVSTLTKIVSSRSISYDNPYTTQWDSTKAYIVLIGTSGDTDCLCTINTNIIKIYSSGTLSGKYKVSISTANNTISIESTVPIGSFNLTLYSLS